MFDLKTTQNPKSLKFLKYYISVITLTTGGTETLFSSSRNEIFLLKIIGIGKPVRE